VIGAAVAGALAALAGTAAAAELRVVLPSDIRSTNAGVNRDQVTDWVLHHVVEGLVALDGALRPAPLLAEDWTVSADGTVYEFRLRDGLTFHNGAPVTASEVVWSWRRLLDPATRWLCRSWFDGSGGTGIRVVGLEAAGPGTVRFTLERPNPLFLTRMAHAVCLSGILHPDSVDGAGRWRMPVATGPYRLADWRRGREVTLSRFEGYRPRPQPADGLAGGRDAMVDTLRLMVVPDGTAAKYAVLSGAADLWPAASAEAVPRLSEGGAVRLMEEETADVAVLLMRDADPLLSDPRIRRAVAHALDRAEIARSTLFARTDANPSAVPRASRFWTPEHGAALPHDPARARALLAEAGYDGQPLRIQVSRDNHLYLNDAVVIQAQLRAAGLNAVIETYDWATQYRNYQAGDYQLSVMGFSGRPDPTLMYETFVGDRAQRANVVVDEPGAVALLARSAAEPDEAERKHLLADLHARVVEDATLLALYTPRRLTALGPRVAEYPGWALAMPRLWTVRLAEDAR